MGKKSVKENKNVYQITRESLGLTREQASELMGYISADKIEKIENERAYAHPDEVMTMASCYKNPHLCNYYCSNECPIGQRYIPEIEVQTLSRIILSTIDSLNHLNEQKNRLIEITADGEITEDEYADFKRIDEQLTQMSSAINGLKLWIEKSIADGDISEEYFSSED